MSDVGWFTTIGMLHKAREQAALVRNQGRTRIEVHCRGTAVSLFYYPSSKSWTWRANGQPVNAGDAQSLIDSAGTEPAH